MLPVSVQRQGNGPLGDLEHVGATSGNQANANAVATLAHDSKKRVFLTGFEMTAAGATAAGVVVATVTGLMGGTRNFIFVAPAGVTVAAAPLVVEFPVPIPAVDLVTDIVVTLPALGAGNTNAAVNASGFKVSLGP